MGKFGWNNGLQKPKCIERPCILHPCRPKRKRRPSQLNKSDVSRRVHSGEYQITGNLTDNVGGGPEGVSVIEFVAVQVEVFFHTAIC